MHRVWIHTPRRHGKEGCLDKVRTLFCPHSYAITFGGLIKSNLVWLQYTLHHETKSGCITPRLSNRPDVVELLVVSCQDRKF